MRLPLLVALAFAFAIALAARAAALQPVGSCCAPSFSYDATIWACVPDANHTTDAGDDFLNLTAAPGEYTTEPLPTTDVTLLQSDPSSGRREEETVENSSNGSVGATSEAAVTWGYAEDSGPVSGVFEDVTTDWDVMLANSTDERLPDTSTMLVPENCEKGALVDVPEDQPLPEGVGRCLAGDGLVRVCVDAEEYCASHYCLPKCCPHGQSLMANKECLPSTRGLPLAENLSLPQGAQSGGVALVAAGLSCIKYPLQPDRLPHSDGRRLERDDSAPGRLALAVPAVGERHVLGRYCLEFVDMPPKMQGVYAFVCFPDTVDEVTLKHKLESAGLVLSVACLGFTLAVYACLPTLQNLHGRTLMCHIAALLAAYIGLAVLKIFTGSLRNVPCTVTGVLTLFFFLAAFSWLTIMCFDIWWTFGAVRSSRESSRRSRTRRLFTLYSLYAWGVPTVITGVAYYLSATGRMFGLGRVSCFIQQGRTEYLEVFSAPVGAQLLVNVVLFALTARCCWRVKADLERMAPAAPTKRKYRADLAKVVMNAKLFVVMGLTFTLDVVSGMWVNSPAWVWYIPDTVNVLQGVLISAIFVLKRRVLRALARRLGLPWGSSGSDGGTGGANTPPSASATSRAVRARSLTPAAAVDTPIPLKSTPSNSTLLTTISINNHNNNNSHHIQHKSFITTRT
ncbi:uncharacterized protein LOC124592796 [Schistocerca americana]|uniref:uncharacterized protein LOC124592796 n=1 Tax=Schistocerca americana TaxID=7009 RepID=UPI001F4FD3E0|nr:uncharacterized protein LOC124592796 [Schistocerca americana]